MNRVYTVSTINSVVKTKLSADRTLQGIAVKGELLNCSMNSSSGHFYFSLADEASSVRGVMYASNAKRLKFAPFDGMAVIAYGGVGLYERDGTFQFVATQLIPDGRGSEYLALQMLKEKLKNLGVFSAPKKPLPRYPKKIAVVTSATGAAIEDVKNVVSRRYPIAALQLFPTAVQGADAPAGIASALMSADQSGADVIILTRGGGSAEDLSAFNTEAVVMAVYSCDTPVVSAVGHEIDLTLSDLAADLRAPTPSAAAELVTPDIESMRAEISLIRLNLCRSAEDRISRARDEIVRYRYALDAMSVTQKIRLKRAETAAYAERIAAAAEKRFSYERMNLNALRDLLSSLNPENVLSRGYAMVYKDGNVALGAGDLEPGDGITVKMRDGFAEATVNSVKCGDEL